MVDGCVKTPAGTEKVVSLEEGGEGGANKGSVALGRTDVGTLLLRSEKESAGGECGAREIVPRGNRLSGGGKSPCS